MNPIEIANSIISFPKNQRLEFKKLINSNPDLWNAIHGIGNVNPDLEKGTIIGLVKEDTKLVSGVTVKATKDDGEITETITSDNGDYSLELDPGIHDLSYAKNGFYETLITEKAVATSTEIIVNAELTKTP